MAALLRGAATMFAGAGLLLLSTLASAAQGVPQGELSSIFPRLEQQFDTRLGAEVLDMRSGERWSYREDERFPFASTFKVFLCAALLDAADRGKVALDHRVGLSADDLVTYSPFTETRLAQGVTLKEACAATMRLSDNTAANIVIDALGGPAAITGFMRSIGDRTTRLDRRETELNSAIAGDERDTTTPGTAVSSVRELVLGDALSPQSREQLKSWLLGNEVGGPLLRAGLPQDWTVADRTGAAANGTRGVIAVLYPPHRPAVVAAIYMTGRDMPMEDRNSVMARIGEAIGRQFAGP